MYWVFQNWVIINEGKRQEEEKTQKNFQNQYHQFQVLTGQLSSKLNGFEAWMLGRIAFKNSNA